MKNGGFCENNGKVSKYMTLIPNFIPRGCYKEIRKYQLCAEKSNAEACFNEKVDIMEVCPDHVLEGLREKKKWYLRAEVIDNQTYKRAMSVGDYNKGKTVTDLQLKTWEYGKGGNLRSDSLWQDDRYNPTKYSHPHRYDNTNFPDQEYKDIFGGTTGQQEKKEIEHYSIGVLSGKSKAMEEHSASQRTSKSSIKDAVHEVSALNAKKDAHAPKH